MNGITTRYRRILLTQITSGAISTIPSITHIALGTGGIDTNDNKKQVYETQTELYSEIARYPVEIEYPTETTVRYKCLVPVNDLVGEKINEIGLIDSSGGLCGLNTMYPLQKDAVLFEFQFDDEF